MSTDMEGQTMKRSLLLIATGVLFACSSPIVHVAPPPPPHYAVVAPSSGAACGLLLFGAIPIGVNDRNRRAYEEAVEAVRATSLIDTTVTTRWYWTPVGSVQCNDIAGTAVRSLVQPCCEPHCPMAPSRKGG
jgi:hypothetical protein